MCKVAFYLSFIFYTVMAWANIYKVTKDPMAVVDAAIACMHAMFGIGLTFFILFRAFYGAALGKPCWLIYKALEALYIVLCKLRSVLPHVHIAAKDPRSQVRFR